jgi:hypothetical protein
MKTTFSLTHRGMGDLLLFVHGVMKICLVFGVMVLVATWPASGFVATACARAVGKLFTTLSPSSAANKYFSTTEGEAGQGLKRSWLQEAATTNEPISALDADAPKAHASRPDASTRLHTDWWDTDSDAFEPAFNIDGTMMMGSFDINGNMYGVTNCAYDSWDSSAATSMWDD